MIRAGWMAFQLTPYFQYNLQSNHFYVDDLGQGNMTKLEVLRMLKSEDLSKVTRNMVIQSQGMI